jgi:hypothetical protein
MRNSILFEVIKRLSSLKYAYTSTIRGCVICVLRERGLSEDALSEEDYEYITKKTISVFNQVEEGTF